MKFVGRTFLLQLDDGDGGYTTVACQLTTSFAVDNELIDITDKDDQRWRKLLAGAVRDLKIDCRGLVNDSASFAHLRDAAAAGTISSYRLLFETSEQLRAPMQVMSFEGSGDYGDAEIYTLSLVSADEVETGSITLDPYFSNVVALLPFDAAGGSGTIADVTGKTWTSTSAVHSTAEFVSGSSSMAFGGGTEYIVGPRSNDFNFSGVDATIEGFVRVSAFTSDPQTGVRRLLTLATSLGIATYGEVIFAVDSSSGNRFKHAAFTAAGATIFDRNSTATYSTLTWYHWAVTKQFSDGNWVWRLFIAGNLDDSFSTTTDVPNTNYTPVFSRHPQNPTWGNFSGYCDEVRITKGVCRYTATFTPPVGSFPRS